MFDSNIWDKTYNPMSYIIKEEKKADNNTLIAQFKNGELTVAMPKKYIINRNATILIWEDNKKTVVKRCEGDEFNKKLGFLTAFFQHYSGMSKNKANKFLAELEVEGELEVKYEIKEETKDKETEEKEKAESKFKIGDKVRVKDNIKDTYGITRTVIEKMKGKKFIISEINKPCYGKNYYSYRLKNGMFIWREDMLEFANTPKHMKEDN